MASLMVIKVRYGDTLRRFNANVNENDQLDLDMAGLKAKVISLFGVNRDADIKMTYTDEDGDVVTLVDDDDLGDVMRQQLKFLRISVQLNSAPAGRSYARSSGNSTPLRSPRVGHIPNVNRVAAEVIQAIPDALRAPLLKLSADVASKAASSSPIVSELIEAFTKIGLYPSMPDFQAEFGDNNFSENPAALSTELGSNSDGKQQASPKQADFVEASTKSKSVGWPSVDLNQLPMDSLEPLRFEPTGNISGADRKEKVSDLQKGKSVSVEKTEGLSAPTNDVKNECPFSGVPVLPTHSYKYHHAEDMGGVFHRGIRCDGCGVHPITGPRFKSNVKEDYDLCSICFAKIGSEAEYIRYDRPIPLRRPRLFKGLHDHVHHPRVLPPHITGCGRKCTRLKLDSHFILDVNINDGTLITPGSPFTKIWRMRNNGGLVWPHGTQLVWIGGDRFSEALSVEVEIPANGVAVDGEIDVAVDFTAPMYPGRYVSYWRMSSPSGLKFGQRVWVLIQVEAALKKLKPLQALPLPNLNLPIRENPKVEDAKDLPNKDSDIPQNYWFLEGNAMNEHITKNEQDQGFPTNDTLIVGRDASVPLSVPSAIEPVSPVSYPIIDLTEGPTDDVVYEPAPVAVTSSLAGNASSSSAPPVVYAGTSEGKLVREAALLIELEEMGFKQIDLNTKILRKNEYDLEKSVDDLCGVSEWDPILEDLVEMGFCDMETNKKLLMKNNGSIKRVVMDLVNGEKP